MRKNKPTVDLSVDDVTEIERHFKDYITNITSDEKYFNIINKFNRLPLDEKRIFIIYILCENNAVAVASQLGCSAWIASSKVRAIKDKLK